MSDPHRPTDQSYVVIQDGQRVSGPLDEHEARMEAERRNQKLLETQSKTPGAKVVKAEVKQNLLG